MAFDEKNLQDLSTELRNFTEGMRIFADKGGFKGGGKDPNTGGQPSSGNATPEKIASTFDKSTQKIVNALGTLGAELTKNARSEAQKTKYLDNFNKAVEKSTKVQEDSAAVEAKLAAEKHSRETEGQTRSAEALKRHNVAQEEARKKNLNWSAALKEATAQMELSSKEAWKFSEGFATARPTLSKAVEAVSATFDVLAKSITGYTSAIYSGERGAKVAAKALSEVGKPVMELADTFANMVMAMSFFMPGGAFGKVVTFVGGLALKLFGKAGEAALKYNELAAEQGDKLYSTFMELGKSGVNLKGGMTETFNTMQEFGMSVSEATQFTSMLAGSAKDLKFLGTTAGQGAKEFSKVAGTLYKSDMGRQLELMGVSAEEQRESALKFMSIQARTGQIQTKNSQDLVKASAAFTKELDLAATLAGNTRKEQMEAREMALSDERFRSAMDEAVAAGDTDRIAELEKANAMAAQLRASGDEEGAAGVLQLAASRGAMTTEAAIAAQMQYGAGDFIFDKTKTVDNIGEITGGMAKNAARQNAQFAGVNNMVGNIGGMQTKGVGSRDRVARNARIEEGMKKEGFTGTIDEYLKTDQGKRIDEADPKTVAQNKLLREQQNSALQMDQVVNSLYDVSRINGTIAESANIAAEALKKIAESMGVNVDHLKPGGESGKLSTGGTTGGTTGSTTGGTTGGTPSYAGKVTSTSTDSLASRAGRAVGKFFGVTPKNTDGMFKDSSTATPTGAASTGTTATSSAEALSMLNFDGSETGNPEGFNKLNSELQKRVLAAAVDYNKLTGDKLQINSTRRSAEHQARLFADYEAKKAAGLNPPLVGKTSRHTEGLAIDIQQGKSGPVSAVEILNKHGVKQPIPNHPIHFEKARTGGIFKGPSTGYNVELHGDEAVVPMNEGVSKQALNTSIFNQDTGGIVELKDMFRTIVDQNYQMIDLLARNADNGEKLVQAAY